MRRSTGLHLMAFEAACFSVMVGYMGPGSWVMAGVNMPHLHWKRLEDIGGLRIEHISLFFLYTDNRKCTVLYLSRGGGVCNAGG